MMSVFMRGKDPSPTLPTRGRGSDRRATSVSPLVGEMAAARGGILARTIATLGILSSLLFAQPALALDKPAVEAQFRAWLEKTVWPEAEKNKVPRETFDAAFKGVTLNWSLPDLVPPGEKPPPEQKQSQAEFSTPAPYFDDKKMAAFALKGQQLMAQHMSLLKRLEKTYGVPGDIILALWGRETGYGAAASPYPAMQVLATKAFMSTRKDLFLKELVAALQISAVDKIDPKTMKSSWAGAMGQPQFMPSSFLQYAVDFDGDKKVDIWNSVPGRACLDRQLHGAEGLAARTRLGCRGHGSRQRVLRPGRAGQGKADREMGGRGHQARRWQAVFSRRAQGRRPDDDAGRALRTAFIVTPNFYVLKEYNNSDLYALYVGNLADRIVNPRAGAFAGKWGDVGKMLRSDVQAMQEALVKKGYDVGKVDGLPGYKTRRSIGDFEAKNGLKQTCYPDAA